MSKEDREGKESRVEKSAVEVMGFRCRETSKGSVYGVGESGA